MSENEDLNNNNTDKEQNEATADDGSAADPTSSVHNASKQYASLTSRTLAPFPVQPSGEAVDAKTTLRSLDLPAAAEVRRQSPHADYQSRAAAACPSNIIPPPVLVISSGEVINAKNTMREFDVDGAAAPNNNSATNYISPLQAEEETLQEEEPITITNSSVDCETEVSRTNNLPVAIVAQEFSDTAIATAVPLRQSKRLFLWLTATLLVLAAVTAAAVVGGYCSGGHCQSGSGGPPTIAFKAAPAPTATIAPGSAPTSIAISNRSAAVLLEINSITLTQTKLTYPAMPEDRPENLALQWLINEPLQLATETATDKFRLRQRYALLTIWFQSTQSWNRATGWLEATDECDWFGISCNRTNYGNEPSVQNAVIAIDLPSNNLHGNISSDLGLLRSLRRIDVCCQTLTGSLPEALAQWTDLDYVHIGDNSFSGTLPESIGNWWSRIEEVGFDSNRFGGTLPESIGNWSYIQTISILNNRFSGALPESIWNWSFIQNASFSSNFFSGTLPESIGKWSSIQTADFSHNRFNGTLPESVGTWSHIEEISFQANQFNGTLPESIGHWRYIRRASFADNHFAGNLPESIGNWSRVEAFFFLNNGFTGSMPYHICAAVNLTDGEADCILNCTCCHACAN